MAYDKVVDSAALEAEMAATAAAIREKGGTTEAIQWVDGLGFADAVRGLPAQAAGYEFTKVGEMAVSFTAASITIKDAFPRYAELTANDLYLVPKNFIVFSTDGAATGQITTGTYAFTKKYTASSGTFTAQRASVSGKVGINFDCEVYAALEVAPDYVDGLVNDALEAIENGAY